MINLYAFIWIGIAWLMIFFFTGIEIAFINANKLSIELKKKQGIKRGIILSHLMENPAQFIGAILVGFTIFLVLFGLMVGETLSPFWNWLITIIHIPSGYVNAMRLFFETILSTIFILFFGSVLPKSLFRTKSDALLGFFARTANFFYEMFSPMVNIFVT